MIKACIRPEAVFRTVQGPHRDGGDNAEKTGRRGTACRDPLLGKLLGGTIGGIRRG